MPFAACKAAPGRLAALAATTSLVILAGALPAHADGKKWHTSPRVKQRKASMHYAAKAPEHSPSGQTTTRTGFLPARALTFDSADTGWTPYGGSTVQQTPDAGNKSPGALRVAFNGNMTGAASPHFTVTPGARYFASGTVRAADNAHSLTLAERYYDGNGALIPGGTVVGQALPDTASGWTTTTTVIGFAPPHAATAQLLLLGTDTPAGDVHYLDDVSLAQTTGVASSLVAPLSTNGRFVLDGMGRRVHFRGIDVNGLQYSSHANVTTSEILAAQQWGANFVRLPLAENYALPGDCLYDGNYLTKVDQLVGAATSRGMFVMLDLHTQSLQQCSAPAQQVMPDQGAVTFWTAVARRYATDPRVGFDLYNEPQDVTDEQWHDGGAFSSNNVSYTSPGMQALYDAVRSVAPNNLVFASGSQWASWFPYSDPLTGTSNLVYATHAYTCPNGPPESATCNPGPNGVLDPSNQVGSFVQIGKSMPVMVTEFGYPAKTEGRFTTAVNAYVVNHGWVGWDVYTFDGTTSGLFDLVKDTGPLNEPAPSGMAAMVGMLNT